MKIKFTINDLTENARQIAINDFRQNRKEYLWEKEFLASLESFCRVFNLYVKKYDEGYFVMGLPGDEILTQLKGATLSKYLQTNYLSEIRGGPAQYFMGNAVLTPLIAFIKRPYDTDFEELTHQCIESFNAEWLANIEYQDSDDYIIELLQNEYYILQSDKKSNVIDPETSI
jgi:hypothetical protein